MTKLLDGTKLPTPTSISVADEPAALLRFALFCKATHHVAIATLVEIRGSAARALGSQVVVASDGRYAGYVSGGCVEAAVASEALLALEAGEDRLVQFGDGSPFFDISLPCGGGISVAINIVREADQIVQVLSRLEKRFVSSLKLSVEKGALMAALPVAATGWAGSWFHIVYRPKTRLIVSGQSVEAQTVVQLAIRCGYEVFCVSDFNKPADVAEKIDCYTAVLLLHHDLEQEQQVLRVALREKPFYIGALGGHRTHQRRLGVMRQAGYCEKELARIKAPIGLFGPARDSTSLALSVLAEVSASWLSDQKSLIS